MWLVALAIVLLQWVPVRTAEPRGAARPTQFEAGAQCHRGLVAVERDGDARMKSSTGADTLFVSLIPSGKIDVQSAALAHSPCGVVLIDDSLQLRHVRIQV